MPILAPTHTHTRRVHTSALNFLWQNVDPFWRPRLGHMRHSLPCYAAAAEWHAAMSTHLFPPALRHSDHKMKVNPFASSSNYIRLYIAVL